MSSPNSQVSYVEMAKYLLLNREVTIKCVVNGRRNGSTEQEESSRRVPCNGAMNV